MKFTAVTLNLQNGQPWREEDPDNTQTDFPATVRYLRELDADVFFLQEVEQGHDGGEQIEPPPHFSLLQEGFPEFASAFTYPPKNPDELPFGLGLAILSRWPLEEVAAHELPAGGVEFDFGGRRRLPSRRSLLRGRATTPAGSLHLLNTHLQAFFMIGASSEENLAQRNCVVNMVQGLGDPILLGGDFNAAPDERLVEQMARAGLSPAQTTQPTWKRRPYVVDHLFNSSALRLESCEVLPTEVTDHHAVRAVYTLGS